MQNQNGQTLIETLVASFILVMGISAALTLATYSLSATNNIRQQTIGLGLAREGIEVVKNMRDTNWLRGTLSSGCYDFLSQTETAFCYQDWLNAPNGSDLNGSGSPGIPTTYQLVYEPNPGKPEWFLRPTEDSFGLDTFAPMGDDGSRFSSFLYNSSNVSVSNSNSGFGRRISLTTENFPPFDQNTTGPRLKVTSEVWWQGKNCPLSDLPPENSSCKAVLETYLTNWRNF